MVLSSVQNNREKTMNVILKSGIRRIFALTILFVIAIPYIPQHQSASANSASSTQETRTDYYNTLQTMTYLGASESFQQNLRAIVRSTTLNEESQTVYRMAFEGGVTYPSLDTATVALSDVVIISREKLGKLTTSQPSLFRLIKVINESVDWAIVNALPENKQLRIPIDFGNNITSYTLMTFDLEPVDIGAGEDTKLVTIKTPLRQLSGRSGIFEYQYKSMFIYSPKNDQLYQSTSVFTAKNGSEQLIIEEQTFLTASEGASPRYQIVDYKNRLGTFSEVKLDSPMVKPPPPWVIEAIAARESLYCAGKAIVYQKTNWVFVSAFIANTSYALMNYAWQAAVGESLIASVGKNFPEIGTRLRYFDVETITCKSSTAMEANQLQLSSTVAIESTALGAVHVAIIPDAIPIRRAPPSTPDKVTGSNLASTAIVIGVGAGAAVVAGESGGSSGGGSACAGNGLIDNYSATVSSPCMGTSIPASDISFALNLSSSCSVTGIANVYGLTLNTTNTTWSYNSGILIIGSYSNAVTESATTFTTPLEQIFPAVASAIEASVDLLPPVEIQSIIDNCGSVAQYVADLQLTWTR
jgi:hypothetical protein